MKKNYILAFILIVALGAGGYLLIKEGNDAVTLAVQKKSGILTTDQVNVSFQQVGGRVINQLVQEEQRVKKGDVLMVLDPTDTDLAVAKLESELSTMDLKIKQAEEAIGSEDITRQQLVVEAASESLKTAKVNYQRTKELYDNEATTTVNFENAETQFTLAQNKLNQENEVLSKYKKDMSNKIIGIDLLRKQKEGLNIQLNSLNLQRERLTLKAPVDGKIVRVIPKVGENVAPGVPVILLESGQLYLDVYVAESQVMDFQVGEQIPLHLSSLNRDVKGVVRFITAAPQFASLRKTADKGLSDLNSFQVRVYIEQDKSILPGITAEVKMDEITT